MDEPWEDVEDRDTEDELHWEDLEDRDTEDELKCSGGLHAR